MKESCFVFYYRAQILKNMQSYVQQNIDCVTLSSVETTTRRIYSNKSSAVAEMGDRLATIDVGRKLGAMGCAPPFGGAGAGSYLTQYCLGRGLPPYQVAS